MFRVLGSRVLGFRFRVLGFRVEGFPGFRSLLRIYLSFLYSAIVRGS